MTETPTIWDLFELEDQVAIVTGGAGQLGREMCEALAEAGAHVVVASRTYDDCVDFAETLTEKHARAVAVEVDVTVEESIETMIDTVRDEFGRLDILVNNAYEGSGYGVPFEDLSLEQWRSTVMSTLTQTFLCSQAAVPELRKQPDSTIINIGSIYGVVAPDHRIYGESELNNPPQYGAAKAGVIQFTRWLATYLAQDGIRVNALSPGGFYSEEMENVPRYTDTFVPNYESRTPLGRMGEPGDLKGAIVFLASAASRWVTGQNLLIDGGWTTW